ncbi:MAG TPA: YtxH domain-containing protein [Candidatus Onthousia faecavium]|nr:YtxH domain-containing protein [Candidatus Onthousia faecavium]
MSKGKGIGKFVAGVAIGAGLGILFAPKKGSETRKDLKDKLDNVVAKIKSLDKEEIKKTFENKVEEIKTELEDLDKEKVLKIAKKKGEDIKKKCQDLVNLAVAKGTPVLEKAAEELRLKAIDVVSDVLEKLEAKGN